MKKKKSILFKIFLIVIIVSLVSAFVFSSETEKTHEEFPRSFESYEDSHMDSIVKIIVHRIKLEPFNFVAALIFVFAIVHILMASWIKEMSHQLEHKHNEKKKKGLVDPESYSLAAGILHFLGEVEAVFGIWTIALGLAISFFFDWETFVTYVGGLDYNEPMYTIVIMTIASSRPILKMVELLLWKIVKFFGGSLDVWWLTILILAPLSGSFITEPAAMTIGAFLLAEKFYDLNPSKKLKYASLALLFVNVSLGGTLTNFAGHPILMVAHIWHWDTLFTLTTIGLKAVLAISISTGVYYLLLKDDIKKLKVAHDQNRYKKYIQRRFISQKKLEKSFDVLELEVNSETGFTERFIKESDTLKEKITKDAYEALEEDEIEKLGIENAIEEKFADIKIEEMKRTIPGLLPEDIRPFYRDPNWDTRDDRVPLWIMLIHVVFIIWTVFHADEPVLFIGGFLFYLGFFQITAFYQNRVNLKPAMLVAFFIAGIIIHGSLQGWWIAPLLEHLNITALNISSLFLSSFNDNASITYLATLVDNLSASYKYAIVTGAITGGGLTLIANSPNPVGQSILKRYFKTGVSAMSLLKFALLPTAISWLCFWILK